MAGQVLHLLETGAPPGGAPEDRSRLRGHLDEFRRRLSIHFASEELEWNGRPEGRMDRTTSLWIERLVREHRGFERRIDDVVAQLDSARETTSSPAGEIRGILEELLEHELSEARLFQRTVFEGAADFSGDSRGASSSG